MAYMIDVRETVAKFAVAMESELRAYDGRKGIDGWKGASIDDVLLPRLFKHINELVYALRPDATPKTDAELIAYAAMVREKAADASNFCMMIADVCAGLDGVHVTSGRAQKIADLASEWRATANDILYTSSHDQSVGRRLTLNECAGQLEKWLAGQ